MLPPFFEISTFVFHWSAVISFRWTIPVNLAFCSCSKSNYSNGIDIFTTTHQESVWLQNFWNSHDFTLFFFSFLLLSPTVLLVQRTWCWKRAEFNFYTEKQFFFSLYRKQDSLCTSESSRDWSWLSNCIFQKPVNHKPTQIFTSKAPQISRYAVCWGQKYWLCFFQFLSRVALWSNRLLHTVDC